MVHVRLATSQHKWRWQLIMGMRVATRIYAASKLLRRFWAETTAMHIGAVGTAVSMQAGTVPIIEPGSWFTADQPVLLPLGVMMTLSTRPAMAHILGYLV